MRLIGMLDSPFVRRVAISMKIMRIDFTHEPVSVFSTYDAFAAINPVVKAPTLVTDTGIVLMESSLILEYLAGLVPAERRLRPEDLEQLAQAQRCIGLSLTACEKTVQIAYEQNLRPADKRHQPWLDRVATQLQAAYRLLEADTSGAEGWLFGAEPLQADITVAVGWRFSRSIVPDLLDEAAYPALARLAAHAEQHPAFATTPAE